MKDNTNIYIISTIALGFIYLAFVFFTSPQNAPGQVPAVFAFVGVVLALLQKGRETDEKVTRSTELSAQNASSIEQVAEKIQETHQLVDSRVADLSAQNAAIEQVAAKVDGTHDLVNSRMTELLATVRELAATQQQLESARSKAEGIEIGREQMQPPEGERKG